MKRGALFFDRDGTLIEHVHYLRDPAQVRLLPGVSELLAAARDAGYLLFVLTNQSGVGRGYFTLAEAEACNVRMVELIGLGPDVFTEICIAPERPDEPSRYRKPKPDFLLEKIREHELDPEHCVMLGDMPTDWETAANAGIAAVAVRSATSKPKVIAQQEALGLPFVSDLRDLVLP